MMKMTGTPMLCSWHAVLLVCALMVLIFGVDAAFVPNSRTWNSSPFFSASRRQNNRLFLSTTEKTSESSKESSEEKPMGHDVNMGDPVEISPEIAKLREAFIAHQEGAAKLGFPADVRSLIQYNHGYAVMSTISKSNPGYPGGSVVGFAPDDEGRPVFLFSGMSAHTQDILANPKCSVTIASKEFKGAADGRVNLMGTCEKVPADERDDVKQVYMAKHPGAFWAEFGDFNWFRMNVEDVRFVGGFARAGSITADEYLQAKPDPIMEFGPDIALHMNEDHMKATVAIVASNVPGVETENIKEAIITSVDSLGMFVKIIQNEEKMSLLGQPRQFKVRVPFPRPAAERSDVKTLIVEMMQATADK